jgi:hypothetical protein
MYVYHNNTGTLAVHISIAINFQFMNVNFDDCLLIAQKWQSEAKILVNASILNVTFNFLHNKHIET